MFIWLDKLMHRTGPQQFETEMDTDVAIERIKKHKTETLFSWHGFDITKEKIQADFPNGKVEVWVSRRYLFKPYRLYYLGKFEKRGEKNILTGEFKVNWFIRYFSLSGLLFICAMQLLLFFSDGQLLEKLQTFLSLSVFAFFWVSVGPANVWICILDRKRITNFLNSILFTGR